MASGIVTSRMAAIQASAARTSCVTGPLVFVVRMRSALSTWVTGLAFAIPRSQDGIVERWGQSRRRESRPERKSAREFPASPRSSRSTARSESRSRQTRSPSSEHEHDGEHDVGRRSAEVKADRHPEQSDQRDDEQVPGDVEQDRAR